MDYGELVASYQKIEETTSTDEKTTVVASALGNATMEEIRMLLPLFQGAVTPVYEQADLGISSNLTLQALTKATGVAQSDVETTWRETGDLGTAAANAVEHQTQQTLFATDLAVEFVSETLRDLIEYEGKGSQQRRIDAVAKLLSDADPDEARYIVRTVLGHLRIRIGGGNSGCDCTSVSR